MSNLQSYQTFASLLPEARDLPQQLPNSPDRPAVHGTAIPDPAMFIAPNLALVKDCPDPRVLLVRAPAAVGKSRLAADLSIQTGNPLLDLGDFSLGSNFFTGTITEIYGPAGFANIMQSLSDGRGCLLLDAADEALVRSGFENFSRAIDNLVRLANQPSSGFPFFVIFGREDTIHDIQGLLDAHDLPFALFEVCFFTEPQSRDFISRKATTPNRPAIKELDAFLTDFITLISRALGGEEWSSWESFLGYAPVLDAIATFYRSQENPIKRLAEIKRDGSGKHVWSLLVEIIESVCEREANKFASSFGGNSAEKRDFGRAVYTLETQVSLLSASDPSDIDFPFPDSGDPDWLDDLQEQVTNQFRDHPFNITRTPIEDNPLARFTNTAFRDYVVAKVVVSAHEEQVREIREHWESPQINASPMMTRFIFFGGMETSRPLTPDAIAVLADSHAADIHETRPRTLIIEEVDGEDGGDGASNGDARIRVLHDDSGASQLGIRFSEDGCLSFGKSLANIEIDTPSHNIRAGVGFQDFTVGPNVAIDCDEFSCHSPELRIKSSLSPDHSRVFILANRISGSTRRVAPGAPNLLVLEVPSAPYPWQAFLPSKGAIRAGLSRTDFIHQGIKFRKMANWFSRKSMFGGPLSYPMTAFDTILSKKRAPRDIFDYCRERGYLTVEDRIYSLKWPVDTVSALTVDESDPDFVALVQDFMKWSSTRQG